MEVAIKIMTLNTAGLNNPIKKRTAKLIRDKKVDVISLSPRKCFKNSDVKYMRQVFFRCVISCSFSTKTRGVFLGFSKRIAMDTLQCILDPKGWYIIWWASCFHLKLTIIVAYAPNMGQQPFWE